MQTPDRDGDQQGPTLAAHARRPPAAEGCEETSRGDGRRATARTGRVRLRADRRGPGTTPAASRTPSRPGRWRTRSGSHDGRRGTAGPSTKRFPRRSDGVSVIGGDGAMPTNATNATTKVATSVRVGAGETEAADEYARRRRARPSSPTSCRWTASANPAGRRSCSSKSGRRERMVAKLMAVTPLATGRRRRAATAVDDQGSH